MRHLLLFALLSTTLHAQAGGKYNLVIEAFDWGPGVTKVVVPMPKEESAANDYAVQINKRHVEAGLDETDLVVVQSGYASDAAGNRTPAGAYYTLVLPVGPQMSLTNPLAWVNDKFRNEWADLRLEIVNKPANAYYGEEGERYFPNLADVELDQVFRAPGADHELHYASYGPPSTAPRPLLIWLHGGGEGGTDTRIPLLANRAIAYAESPIQDIMGGAHVLYPQAPTYWMESVDGTQTWGDKESKYTRSLLALIQDYVARHPGVDASRVYVGGCSNGGFMTLKLLLAQPGYFAASFPSALGYKSEYLSDQDILTLGQTPSWYVHARDDTTTPFATTAGPVVERLEAVGGAVYASFYEHVYDLTGLYGGKDYWYPGHFSWVPCHANHCRATIGGRSVTIMEWLSRQHLGK